ncbi:MAG TPA: DinB family protein [Gemmatimonadaceae bacterium]
MQSFRIAVASAILPVALAAQQPAAAQANPITAAFKARIAAHHRNIAQAFDSIPESKFGYKPTPAQLTLGYIAQHVASDSYLFCGSFGAMKPTIDARETAAPDSVKATWPKADLVAKLKASFAFCDQAIEQVTDATLSDVVSFTLGGAERKAARVNLVLLHALDLADHYSQIANYMRLNGLVPPSALPRPARGGH